MNKVAINVFKGIAVIAVVITWIVSTCGIIAMAVLFSSCGKDEGATPSVQSLHPRFSLQMPTCNWDSGVLTAADTIPMYNVVEGDSVKVGTCYRYVTDNFSAVVNVNTQRQITQITGGVSFYSYYVDLPTSTMHLCNSAGSYPVTYSLIY